MSSVDSWLSKVGGTRSGGLAFRASAAHLARDVLAAQRTALPWALVATVTATVLLGMGLYVLAVTGQSLSILLRDANAIAGQPNYFAALEHAGILLMGGAGSVAVFSGVLCRGQAARLLVLGGLLSLLLAADDLYMFHESSWRFGFEEHHVFAVYGLLLVGLAATSLQWFLKTPFLLLGAALALFAAAILIDAIDRTPFGLPPGTEDCLELIGICFWAAYFVKCSRDALLAWRPDS